MEVNASYIKELVEEKLKNTDCFIVDIKVSPTKIEIYIDKAEGISVKNCIEVSRYITSKLENTDVFETHGLEVSSPGLEEPFKVVDQYKKQVGRPLNVKTKDDKEHKGILLDVTESGISLEECTEIKKNKKREIKECYFNFNEIKETRIILNIKKQILK